MEDRIDLHLGMKLIWWGVILLHAFTHCMSHLYKYILFLWKFTDLCRSFGLYSILYIVWLIYVFNIGYITILFYIRVRMFYKILYCSWKQHDALKQYIDCWRNYEQLNKWRYRSECADAIGSTISKPTMKSLLHTCGYSQKT